MKMQEKYRPYFEILLKCDLFAGMHGEDLEKFLQCVKPSVDVFRKNEGIIHAHDAAARLGVLLHGKANVSQTDVSGNRVLLASLAQGEYFGEIAVFAPPFAYPADVVADGGCTVLFLRRDIFFDRCAVACPFHNKVTENMLMCLAQKAKHLSRRIAYLTLKSPRQKTAAFLLEQLERSGTSTFMLGHNRAQAAEFLNLPRPSFSRELCFLRDEGFIEFDGKAVKILDEAALQRFLG